MELIITDNHCHVNPVKGIGPREIARKFRKENGRVLIVVSLLTWSLDLQPGLLSSFEKLYEYTVKAVQEINNEGVKAYAVIGIHPAEIEYLLNNGWNFEKTRQFFENVLKIIEKYFKEGKVIGLGEIVRPHYEIEFY